MYRVKLASSSADYSVGIPRLDEDGWTDSSQENSLLAGFIDDPARPIAFCAVAENTGGDSSVVEKVVAALIVSLS